MVVVIKSRQYEIGFLRWVLGSFVNFETGWPKKAPGSIPPLFVIMVSDTLSEITTYAYVR